MTNDILEYKGYQTRIEYDADSHCLFGKISGIRDLVTFESTDIAQIEAEFRSAVDDYLSFCEEVGKTPDKEYRGMFNIRIQPALHQKLAEKAFRDHDTLNAAVEKAIANYV